MHSISYFTWNQFRVIQFSLFKQKWKKVYCILTIYSIESHKLISRKISVFKIFSNFHTVQNVWRRKCQMHFFNFVYTSCQYFFLLCKIARDSKTFSHVWKRILCNFMATWNGIIGKFIQNLFQISVTNFLSIDKKIRQIYFFSNSNSVLRLISRNFSYFSTLGKVVNST